MLASSSTYSKDEKSHTLLFFSGPPIVPHVVLPGEWLLGLWRGVVQLVAGVECRCPLIECRRAMPLVGAMPGAYDHRASHSAAGVRILLGGLHGEFLKRIRGKVLQEAANVVVGVVPAIDGQLHVQAR